MRKAHLTTIVFIFAEPCGSHRPGQKASADEAEIMTCAAAAPLPSTGRPNLTNWRSWRTGVPLRHALGWYSIKTRINAQGMHIIGGPSSTAFLCAIVRMDVVRPTWILLFYMARLFPVSLRCHVDYHITYRYSKFSTSARSCNRPVARLFFFKFSISIKVI